MEFEEERLADVVSSDPVVFMDCTGPQIMTSGLLGSIAGLVVGIVIGISIGFFFIGLALGMLLSLLFSYLAMLWIQSNREKYYETWLSETVFFKKRSLVANFGVFLGKTPSEFIEGSRRFGRGARK